MDACTAASLGDAAYLEQAVADGRLPRDALDKANASGWTPLMYAAYLGHESLVKLLLEKYGASVSATADKRRRTALMLACSCGHRASAIALANASYSTTGGSELPDPVDLDGRNAAMHCVLYGQRDCLEDLLLRWQRLRSICGLEHLRQAMLGGHTATAELLLDRLYGARVPADLVRPNSERGHERLVGTDSKRKAPALLPAAPPASVEAVFAELQLAKYAHLFDGMPMHDFLRLTEDQVIARGLTIIGPKRKLVSYLTQLRSNQATQPPPQPQLPSADTADSIRQAKASAQLLQEIIEDLTAELGKCAQPAKVEIWLHKLGVTTNQLRAHLDRATASGNCGDKHLSK